MRTRITSSRRPAGSSAQAGFTLIEIMIALTIALVLLTVLSLIFVANGSFRQDLDRSSRLVENSSYSMQRITDDLRLSGYYAEYDMQNGGLATPATKPDACAIDLTSLKLAMPLTIQGYDGGSVLPVLPASCSTVLTDLRPGSDILLIRRVDPCVAGPTTGTGCDAVIAGVPYFQASQCTPAPPAAKTELAGVTSGWFKLDTNTANLNLHLVDCNVSPPGTFADYHRFVVHIYFVSNNDNAGDRIPTLKMAQLDAVAGATAFTVIPLAEGVENLQLEYGLDTTTPVPDGIPDVFTADPDSYNACAGTPGACMQNWLNVVAVKVHMLGRNTEQTAVGYINDKSFTLGLKPNVVGGADITPNTFGPYSDRYKRHVYAAQVRVYNPSGRRE